MRSSSFPSTLSYSTPLYDRTNTFRTPLRSNNTNYIKSYSPSGSKASLKFSTFFGSESRQNSLRSNFRRRSTSISSTVSRPSEMGWRTSSTSIRTSVVRRQGWRSNIFATRISTSEESNRTSRPLRYSTRTTSGYSSTSETVRNSRYRQTWSEISNFGSNLRGWGTSRKIG